MRPVHKSELIQWCNDAKTGLNRARELCHTADVLINNLINKLVVELSEKLDSIDEKAIQFRQVNGLISSYIDFLDRKIHKDCISKYNTEYAKLELVKSEFEAVISQLESVNVPGFLIQLTEDSDQSYLLKEFISLDEILLLFENITIHHDNMSKLHRFMDMSFKETVQEPFTKVINKRQQHFSQTYDDLVATHGLNNDTIQAILKENESLGQELVSLLQMLTNHYDQCLLGLKQYDMHDISKGDVNYEVLEQDALESADVLKDLKSIYDIIINNEIRAKKILNSLEPLTEKLSTQSLEISKIYKKFNSTNLFQIIIFLNKYHDMHGKLDLKNYQHIIEQLIYYYTNFLTIFKKKYLVEFHHQQFTYPKQFLNKLNRFLNEELYNFQQDERERRANWLNKYGEFIPKQFKLPGDHQPSVVQVITEDMNDDNEDVLMEKQLLDLIKSFM